MSHLSAKITAKESYPVLFKLFCELHFSSDILEDIEIRQTIYLEDNIFVFDYQEQTIRNFNDKSNFLFTHIPFFIPDFSDINKLTSKLNTYIIFQ